MNTNNIWEIAEAWVAGTLTQEEKQEINQKLTVDAVFASEFNENIQLIQSLADNNRQKKLRQTLTDIHSKTMGQKKKITITLPSNLWRNVAIAAGIALLTTLINFGFFISSNKKGDSQYSTISREVEHIKKGQARLQEQQNAIIDSIKKINTPPIPSSEVRFTGTGFALTNDGYFVTAYHVINKGKFDSVYILCNDDKYYKASLVNFNEASDLALLKIDKKNFHFNKSDVPYSLFAGKAGLGAHIFTVGYPLDDMVYSEGYISARNGYNGNTQQYTLELPAGHGQSGSPVIDAQGNLLGILTAISGPEESNTYAVNSKALIDLIHPLLSDGTLHISKSNKLGRMSREQQIEKLGNYTFSVKVYKK